MKPAAKPQVFTIHKTKMQNKVISHGHIKSLRTCINTAINTAINNSSICVTWTCESEVHKNVYTQCVYNVYCTNDKVHSAKSQKIEQKWQKNNKSALK